MSTHNLCFIKNKVLTPQTVTQENRKCSTCDMSFSDSPSQKLHFKSEWHLYNVKRKNAQINPISYDEYVVIKAQIQELLAAKASKTNNGNLSMKSKTANSSLKAKNGSTPSQEQCKKSIKEETARSITEFDVKRCLFSNVVSENISENVKYMERQYSFYLPEREYISDLSGLLRYLHDKIMEYNMCLYCNRPFSNHYAVLHHMVDKQHHKLNDDHFNEIRQFYDFTGSYLKLITNLSPKVLDSIGDDADDENDWEDIITSTTKGDKIEELLLGYGLTKAHITECGNLSLPNGKEAVHRELSYIYKQNLAIHSSHNLKNRQGDFKFKKRSEKRQIIMTQNQSQYKSGKRDLKVAVKSYKLFVPVRQDICFG